MTGPDVAISTGTPISFPVASMRQWLRMAKLLTIMTLVSFSRSGLEHEDSPICRGDRLTRSKPPSLMTGTIAR